MQIYLKDYDFYSFNLQRELKARYIAKNFLSS